MFSNIWEMLFKLCLFCLFILTQESKQNVFSSPKFIFWLYLSREVEYKIEKAVLVQDTSSRCKFSTKFPQLNHGWVGKLLNLNPNMLQIKLHIERKDIEERGIWQLLVVLCALIKGSKKWWKLISGRRKEEDRQIKL